MPYSGRGLRKSFGPEANEKGGVRHKKDLERDLYVVLDRDVDRGTWVTSSHVTEPQVRPDDTSLALRRRSHRRDLT